TEEYKKRMRELLNRVGDVERSQLAEYVAHRRVILDFFEKAMEQKDDGKFVLEEYIHDLICPRGVTSDDALSVESVNLWVVDERFSFHNYLASDTRHRKVTAIEAEGDKRTDVFLLYAPHAFTDDSAPYQSVVILEFKRPQRDDYTPQENPIEQCIGYVQDFIAGNVKDCRGRQIPAGPQRQFFAYALCDEVKSLEPILDKYSFKKTHDELGFFHYFETLKIYMQVHTLDKLLIDAKRRNRILFEKLCIE
ncbi:MAG TPA: ATP-binding protein, partial [Sumerlaeia bacterium]|nr:ATP-binding protein [Sumerlaeia bacterium]